jgi:hypothetical protein
MQLHALNPIKEEQKRIGKKTIEYRECMVKNLPGLLVVDALMYCARECRQKA